MWLLDAVVQPPGHRTDRQPDFPKEALAHPGCWVKTREAVGGRYLTSIHGGRYNGELFPWECEADADEGHEAALRMCREAFYAAATV